MADSAFAQVTRTNPDLSVGYLWRAKSNTQLDPNNEKALAKPYYEQFTAKVKPEEAEKNKKDLIEAYSYLGYLSMKQKDNASAKTYWQKVIELDPANKKATDALASFK